MSNKAGILLAAGKGTRMGLEIPKVLLRLNGKSLIVWSVEQMLQAGVDQIIVVVGYRSELVKNEVEAHFPKVVFVYQKQQLGTGDAVRVALPSLLPDIDSVLVTYGDMPFISTVTMTQLLAMISHHTPIALSKVTLKNPALSGFGRIERDETGQVMDVIEQRFCDTRQLAIKECNAGPVAYDVRWLETNLPKVKKNSSGEFFLTDLVGSAYRLGEDIGCVEVSGLHEAHGINTPEHLKKAEEIVQAAMVSNEF